MGHLHICAAVLAEFGVDVVPLTAALGTALCRYDALIILHGPLGCYDPRWHGEDGISSDHEKSRHRLAHVGLRRDVTISDRRYRNNCPVDTARYTGEYAFFPFNEIHHRANYDDYVNYSEVKDHNFSATRMKRPRQLTCLVDILSEFKDAKYTENAQRANDQ